MKRTRIVFSLFALLVLSVAASAQTAPGKGRIAVINTTVFQEKIAEFVPDLSSKDFYICGLSPMINGVQEKLLSLGVPKEQIHFEKYD